MKPVIYTLWSLRYSIARGNHWQNERECNDDTANEWLATFKKDEPKVLFLLQKGKRKPPLN